MASVREHYATHLAPIYTWMAGGAEGPRRRFTQLVGQLGLTPTGAGATAVDLGAGNGFQSIPLAAAGFDVTAVDLSAELLAELHREAAGLPIRTICGDLRNLTAHLPAKAPEVIVCMGDTLTHLESLDDVSHLLKSAAAVLPPGGHLLLSFRDYTVERTGSDRFIPVRSESDRILTCFLEYGPTHVTVTDLIYARGTADWRLATSSYQKIRLAPAWVRDHITATGLQLVHQTTELGLVTLAARRPSTA
jgi:2-polyprenyl-3-methyl-5-hydroxy-6-metoxy-1,4-benzoquinol methylase